MLLLYVCLQTPKLKKYYKFQNGPPRSYWKLCYIFTGTTASRKHQYASTQSPPNSICDEHCVDLNLLPAITNLIEGPNCPAQKSKGKSKAKGKGDSLQFSHFSKRSSYGESVYTHISNEFDSIHKKVIQKLEISNGVVSVEDAMSVGHPPFFQHPIEAIMDIINVLAKEISMPTTAYLEACKTLMNPAWVRILLKMKNAGRRYWLLSFIPSSDN
jgi:hypothetical protein